MSSSRHIDTLLRRLRLARARRDLVAVITFEQRLRLALR